ncbi:hypothetical protein V1J52_11280 [Streptomyces sp. TRM 70351]|uniref:hypothetical protein n=1 Tax=Streptomyces sp. TRM 70351 TaxID=3116552 RepID=UPI002E7C550A|nr:hypothetical protein [Streptomyces sp. TRM 70351]MEE1928772.1 hypothetical protein [Streptomyces sp. TRM 70351]
MSVQAVFLALALVAVTVVVASALSRWRPAPRWAARRGRNCPGCGGFRVRTVTGGGRLNGMLECRACHRTWQPAARRR